MSCPINCGLSGKSLYVRLVKFVCIRTVEDAGPYKIIYDRQVLPSPHGEEYVYKHFYTVGTGVLDGPLPFG